MLIGTLAQVRKPKRGGFKFGYYPPALLTGGVVPAPPTGYVFLTDFNGAYLLDSDGAYLLEAA